jgi:hypothetical protein
MANADTGLSSNSVILDAAATELDAGAVAGIRGGLEAFQFEPFFSPLWLLQMVRS